eukprot:CAMPEP_0195514588 /NCGR_PEP_ID=MMETSP0794_2-20130614/5922_1 /TAXON_ID=515487 /ORGANISM="Stephanopyxis turris, Strain CCMP 815" /LENGTH=450 /DNA_ID=CAMNT_0040642851 /DNA_START=310 /DNA_END=1662 /DNA_ORIENTATION=+
MTRTHPVTHTTTTTILHSTENNNEHHHSPTLAGKSPFQTAGRALAAAVMSAILWTSPLITTDDNNNNNPQLGFSMDAQSTMASAKEMASGSGSRVNKDPESLLRYGLPISNKEVRSLQGTIENINYDVTSKRISPALDGVKKTRTALKQKASKLTPSCQDANVCTSIISDMLDTLDPLEENLNKAKDYFSGSEQERKALDGAYAAQRNLAAKLTDLEEQMVPKGYFTPVPSDYDDLPQLRGRATVEFSLKKPDGSPFVVDDTRYKTADLKMIIDGYNAPVTGGNFVQLVNEGFYTNMAIQRSDGFVVQTGDPDGKADGYVAKASKAIGSGPNGERLIPCEISMVGDKAPFYESTMEDEGRGGQATVLPFSSYGAMGWAREEYDANSGSSQFFWLLFDSDLTPAGKNVLDGRYPCFGYVVEGADFLRDMKEGDIIASAKVTEGLEKLVMPK